MSESTQESSLSHVSPDLRDGDGWYGNEVVSFTIGDWDWFLSFRLRVVVLCVPNYTPTPFELGGFLTRHQGKFTSESGQRGKQVEFDSFQDQLQLIHPALALPFISFLEFIEFMETNPGKTRQNESLELIRPTPISEPEMVFQPFSLLSGQNFSLSRFLSSGNLLFFRKVNS